MNSIKIHELYSNALARLRTAVIEKYNPRFKKGAFFVVVVGSFKLIKSAFMCVFVVLRMKLTPPTFWASVLLLSCILNPKLHFYFKTDLS